MRIGKVIFLIFAVFLTLHMAFAQQLSEEEKSYIESQHIKTINQINAKIEAQSSNFQATMKTEVANAKNEIREEVSHEVRGTLKSVAIGLGGMMIVILAVFKILDMRLQHTKRIKEYEEKLKKSTKSFEEGVKANTELNNQILEYKKQLDERAKELGIPLFNVEIDKKQQKTAFPDQKQEKKKFDFFKIVKWIGLVVFVIAFVTLIYISLRYFGVIG